MKHIFTILAFLLAAQSTWGQELIINRKGEVVVAPQSISSRNVRFKQDSLLSKVPYQDSTRSFLGVSRKQKIPKITVSADSLKARNDTVKQHARTEVQMLIDSTLARFKRQTNYSVFYEEVFGIDAKSMLVTQLEPISAKLEEDYERTKTSEKAYVALDTMLYRKLNKDIIYYSLHADVTNSRYQLMLKEKDPLKSFLIDYYNVTANDADNIYLKYPDTVRIEAGENALKMMTDSINQLLRKASGTIDIALLHTFLLSHKGFTAYKDTGYIPSLYKLPMVQQWIWFSGGEPLLNPLGKLLNVQAGKPIVDHSAERAQAYNRYIDSVLERYMRHDTVGNVEAFRKILEQKNTGEELYKKKEQADKYRETLDKFLTVTTRVNTIQIPIENDKKANRYLGHLASEKYDEAGDIAVVAPLTTDDRVFVAVHNLKEGEELQLKKLKAEDIVDRSAFQTGMDSVFSQLGTAIVSLQPALTMPTLFSDLIYSSATRSNVFPKFNGTVPTITSVPAGFAGVTSVNDFWDGVYMAIEAEKRDNSKLRELIDHYADVSVKVIDSFKKAGETADRTLLNSGADANVIERKQRTIATSYFAVMLDKKITPDLVKKMKKDSLVAGMFAKGIASATLPVAELKPKEDEAPGLHSDVRVADYSDQAQELQFAAIKKSKADSATISKFGYRTGKRHFFQVGAGLAYDLSPVRINEVKETATGLEVTTNDERLRFIAGVHLYPVRGLFLQDRKFFGTPREILSRMNILLAIAIPKPLENLYTGIGYDLGPGLRVCYGAHWYKYRSYQVFNDKIQNQSARYVASPFLSVTIDPVSLIKVFNVFK